MNDPIAILFMFTSYLGLPMLLIIMVIRYYQKWRIGSQIHFQHIPNLPQITNKNLSIDMIQRIHSIDQKAKQLLHNYRQQNLQISPENPFIIQKILDEHLPKAIHDYQKLDPQRANQQTIGNHRQTAKQVLIEILDTIDNQFDNMIDACHHQNSEQLLISQRYLQHRFLSKEENPSL